MPSTLGAFPTHAQPCHQLLTLYQEIAYHYLQKELASTWHCSLRMPSPALNFWRHSYVVKPGTVSTQTQPCHQLLALYQGMAR
jgi:hypothetical protein